MAKATTFQERAKQKSSGPTRRLQKGETAEVRFLFEMNHPDNGWKCLTGYFDTEAKRSYFIEDEDDLPKGAEARDSFFAVAYDVNEGTVDVWELRKTLAAALVDLEEEYGSITDRNYKLKRRGSGLDTKYTVTPLDPSKMGKKHLKAATKADGRLDSRACYF